MCQARTQGGGWRRALNQPYESLSSLPRSAAVFAVCAGAEDVAAAG